MNLWIARGLSWLFHPLLMPTLGLILIFQLNTYFAYTTIPELKDFLFSVVFLNTFLIPAFIVSFLVYRGKLPNFQMDERKERWFPFMVTAFFYFFTYFLLKFFNLPLPDVVYSFLLGTFLSLAICLTFNVKWKLSIHAIGLGGLIGALYALAQVYEVSVTVFLIPALFISGLVGAARLKAGTHKPAEIYAGFLIGILSEYSCIAFGLG